MKLEVTIKLDEETKKLLSSLKPTVVREDVEDEGDDDETEKEVDEDDYEDEVEADEVDEDDDEDEKPKAKKAKKLTADDVNEACKALLSALGGGKTARAKVLGILKKKFKTESVSELKPDQYAAVIKAMEAVETE